MFKATTLNGVSILLKVVFGFITSKFIAVFVGANGIALVGNLRNFITSIEGIATLGLENGVVKYVAEYREEKEKLHKALATIFISVIVSCVILMIVMLLFSESLNLMVFGSHYSFSFVFKALALALPFYIGNIILIAAINGFNEYKKVMYINIVGSCMGVIVSVFLIWQWLVVGALLSIIVTPALLFFVSFVTLNRELQLFSNIRRHDFSTRFLKKLSSYSLMALVAAVIGPMVFLAIRQYIIRHIGINDAGYWEAMCRISSYYFLFITSIITIYFLPKMAAATSNEETKMLFRQYYKGIMPLFIAGLIILYIGRELLVRLLFTKEFLPVSQLFLWQLTGDVFKAASFILGYQFYAKRLIKAFIVAELASLAVLYGSSMYLISVYQIEGVVMAHALTYFVYFTALCLYFRKNLF